MSPERHRNAQFGLSQKLFQNSRRRTVLLRLLQHTKYSMNATATGVQLGYARVSTWHQSLDQQLSNDRNLWMSLGEVA